MQKHYVWIALLTLSFIFNACRREEEVIVPGNVAPPDHTIDDITVEAYVNRTYISLLGRKPDDTEAATAKSQLRSSNFSATARETFVDGLIALPEYDQRLFDIGRILLINSADTSVIQEQILLFNLLLTQTQYQLIWPQITIERDNLLDVLEIPALLRANSIDTREMHRRLVTNYIYDQINMGTQNFVISMFQNFFFRYPTAAELAASQSMVDGFTSTVMLQTGRTKTTFIDILLHSGDYAEGQVRDIYLRTLYREPTTEEVETLATQYQASGDYAAMLRTVLVSDEFAGL